MKLSVFFPLLVLTVFLLSPPKIHISIIGARTQPLIEVKNKNSKIDLTELSPVVNNKLTISTLSDKGNEKKLLVFSLPKTGGGSFIDCKTIRNKDKDLCSNLRDLQTVEWNLGPNEERIFNWSGNTSSLSISFLKSPQAGVINLNWNNSLNVIDLKSNKEEWIDVLLPSNNIKFIGSYSPFLIGKLDLKCTSTNQKIELSFGEYFLYNYKCTNNDLLSYSQINLTNRLLYLDVVKIRLQNLLSLLTQSLFLGIFFFISGLILCSSSFKESSSNKLIIFIVGFSLNIVLNTTFLYLNFTGRTASILTIFTIIIAFLVFLLKNRFFNNSKNTPLFSKITKLDLKLFSYCIALSLLYFWPYLSRRDFFLGQIYTDTFWYINGSEILNKMSLNTYLVGMWDWQRVADLSVILNALTILQSKAMNAYVIISFLLFITFPLVWRAILKNIFKTNSSEEKIILSSILPMTPLFLIWSQCYFAQFLITIIYFWSFLFFAHIYLYLEKTKKLFADKPLIICTALILALGLLIYPYFFFVPFVAGILSLIYIFYGKRKSFIFLLVSCPLTLLFMNKGIKLLLNSGGPIDTMEALNGIARNIVFPFHNSFKMFSVTFGFENLAGHTLTNFFKLSTSFIHNFNFFIACFTVLLIISGLLGLLFMLKKEIYQLISLSIIFILILVVYLFFKEQTYAYGKLFMTLAVLFMLPVTFFIFKSFNKNYSFIGNLLLVTFTLISLSNVLLDNAPYYLHHEDIRHKGLRSYISLFSPDVITTMRRLNKINDIDKPSLILGSSDEHKGLDTPRLLAWSIWQELSESNYIKTSEPLGLDPYAINHQEAIGEAEVLKEVEKKNASVIVSFNELDESKLIDYNKTAENPYFSIFEPK